MTLRMIRLHILIEFFGSVNKDLFPFTASLRNCKIYSQYNFSSPFESAHGESRQTRVVGEDALFRLKKIKAKYPKGRKGGESFRAFSAPALGNPQRTRSGAVVVEPSQSLG